MTYLRRADAAAYLQERYGVGSVARLAKLAVEGGGPQFRRIGRYPVYTAEDLDEWMQSRITRPVSSTAELAA